MKKARRGINPAWKPSGDGCVEYLASANGVSLLSAGREVTLTRKTPATCFAVALGLIVVNPEMRMFLDDDCR